MLSSTQVFLPSIKLLWKYDLVS